MNLFKRLLGNRNGQLDDIGFWDWFRRHERSFYNIINKREPPVVNVLFLKKIMPKLHELNEAFYCEAGMSDSTTAELVITTEGDIKSFVFAEELIAAGPALPNWKLTALKPATGAGVSITMDDEEFNSANIGFFFEEQEQYPDEINLTLVHSGLTGENKKTIIQGCFLFLDTVLGELNAVTLIDNIEIKGPSPENKTLIPMEKLNDFLVWKEKEFVEKYEGIRHNTENDEYSIFEGEDDNGLPSIAVINTELLDWDAKASHPWMLVIEIDFEKNHGVAANGMPDKKHLQLMDAFEGQLSGQLTDSAGYLNLGRNTAKGKRKIYLACKEFRWASKTVHQLIGAHANALTTSYRIYKDKYWRTMDSFRGQTES
ncbi:MAG TPA: DUF695 domain-containing protein [Puia sp.]|nr:DUF695 domain-containing protein [Puia sp.]